MKPVLNLRVRYSPAWSASTKQQILNHCQVSESCWAVEPPWVIHRARSKSINSSLGVERISCQCLVHLDQKPFLNSSTSWGTRRCEGTLACVPLMETLGARTTLKLLLFSMTKKPVLNLQLIDSPALSASTKQRILKPLPSGWGIFRGRTYLIYSPGKE